MAKNTIERRIINHIQDAYTGNLQDGKDKIIVIKLAKGLNVSDTSYLYTTASDLLNRFGCLTLFVTDNIRSIDMQNLKDFVASLEKEDLQKLRDVIDERMRNVDGEERQECLNKPELTFSFLDLR
jgi:hypothetical protein